MQTQCKGTGGASPNQSPACQSDQQFASGVVKDSSGDPFRADFASADGLCLGPLKCFGMDWESLVKLILPDSHLKMLCRRNPKDSADPTWLQAEHPGGAAGGLCAVRHRAVSSSLRVSRVEVRSAAEALVGPLQGLELGDDLLQLRGALV